MTTTTLEKKQLGAYYTPDSVAESLVAWAIRENGDHLLDPSCGDGQFLSQHLNSTGIDCDSTSADQAKARCPHAEVVCDDFFLWVAATTRRFECVVGNPPFIRYQTFNGKTRARALKFCEKAGIKLSALTSSWTPFVVASTELLKPGGRLAFVVPAEIGHAGYSNKLVHFLAARFRSVRVIAIRQKVFARLSEDCWLLFCAEYGKSTSTIQFTRLEGFCGSTRPPKVDESIAVSDVESWNGRLRPFLLPNRIRESYLELANRTGMERFGSLASIGIGYVSGANDFFHVRPSGARLWKLPDQYLLPAVRNGKCLTSESIDKQTVRRWIRRDEPCLLLRLKPEEVVPSVVQEYLDSPGGMVARKAYKCRVRSPWYCVPSVNVPDGFLSDMSGLGPKLVRNAAKCVATNSVHVVNFHRRASAEAVFCGWDNPLTLLSAELEGHPLGGGMLKLEPREATRILVPTANPDFSSHESDLLMEGVAELRRWRHYDA